MEKANKITDFNRAEGDAIVLDGEAFEVGKKAKLKTVSGKKKLNKSNRSGKDFVYEERKGQLYYNENGKSNGWGEGGLFAVFEELPVLKSSDLVVV